MYTSEEIHAVYFATYGYL